MRYKLIDIREEVDEDVEFGTCELCMYVGNHYYLVAVVEDENGNTHEFENGYWSWGDWSTYSYSAIENVIDFADWFSKQEFEVELTEPEFWYLTDKYNEEKETTNMTNYIVFDFETTGLNYKEEQVIEIAAAKLDENLNPIDTFNTLVALNEGRILPQFIRQLTGITAEDLEGQMPEDEAMAKLKEFIGDSIVVAQFASFDLSFLSKVLKPEQFICTRSMARMLRPDEYASLKNLIQIYGVENLDPHRAFADVEATIEVFKRQKAECDEQGIEYMNVLIDSNERPLNYVPENAIVKYMEFDKK